MKLKSSAILFENSPKIILTALSVGSIALFGLGGFNAGLGLPFYTSLAMAAAHYGW